MRASHVVAANDHGVGLSVFTFQREKRERERQID